MTTPEVISQAQAEAQGLKRYFTGVPCLNGHRSERWVRGRACIECKRIPRSVVGKRESNQPKRPPKAAPVEAEAVSIEQRSPIWRDPGTRISQYRINELIERIFNDEPPAAESEAA
jgi:hypothetical protein